MWAGLVNLRLRSTESHSNYIMCKQSIERLVTRCSDDGWGRSLFKKSAGRERHRRVFSCASGMAICLQHEAASRVACRRACILIGLICSTINRCRFIKKCPKSAYWSPGWSIGRPLIDTIHKEGKSQRVITERCGCSQSAVSKHIKCKVDWKEELV